MRTVLARPERHTLSGNHPPFSQQPPPQAWIQRMSSAENILTYNPSDSEPAELDWALAIIVDSDDPPCNLQETAMAIASNCQLNYLPSLTLFGDNRALFFCKNLADSIKVSTVAHLRMGISSIFLNKYSRWLTLSTAKSARYEDGFQSKGYLLILKKLTHSNK